MIPPVVGICNACGAPTFRIDGRRHDGNYTDRNYAQRWTNIYICEECGPFLSLGTYSPEHTFSHNLLESPPMREILTPLEYQELYG